MTSEATTAESSNAGMGGSTHQRTLSEDSADPLIGGSPTVGERRFADVSVMARLSPDHLGNEDISDLVETVAQLSIGGGGSALVESSIGRASGWTPTYGEVDEGNWTIWDPIKSKRRRVQADDDGYWYFTKQDGEVVYLS